VLILTFSPVAAAAAAERALIVAATAVRFFIVLGRAGARERELASGMSAPGCKVKSRAEYANPDSTHS